MRPVRTASSENRCLRPKNLGARSCVMPDVLPVFQSQRMSSLPGPRTLPSVLRWTRVVSMTCCRPPVQMVHKNFLSV